MHEAMPPIPPINSLPFGRFEDLGTLGYDFSFAPYLRPYKHYFDHPFMGSAGGVPGFPGFSPADMTSIQRFTNQRVDILHTTRLHVDAKRDTGGVSNMPFVTREAEPVSMSSSSGSSRSLINATNAAIVCGCSTRRS